MTPNLSQHEIAELASIYALGLLPTAEHEAFEARLLAGDAAYVAEFEKVRGVGDVLLREAAPMAAPPAKLPPVKGGAEAQGAGDGSLTFVAPAQQVRFWRTSAAFGWMAAAASLVFALVLWQRTRPTPAPTPPTPAPVTIATIEAMPGTAKLTWSPWPTKAAGEVPSAPAAGVPVPGAEKITGRVAWNNEVQDGFVELANLPSVGADEQYQLWIIDGDQPAPISAGVFDPAPGTTTVRMRPFVRVSKPAAVAVTIEKKGGVVVPDQTKRVVVAPVPKG